MPVKLDRTIALVGMMGAGKSSVGRRLAQALAMEFADADAEIEAAAGRSVADIFAAYGEAAFRDGERKVIARLVDGAPIVLATGGGAFMNTETRALLKERALTIWLRAEPDVLWDRVQRRGHRPLLKTENPRATLDALIAERYPVYAEAEITVESRDGPHDAVVDDIVARLAARGRP